MATVAVTLPRSRCIARNQPASGRAAFPEIYFVKAIDNSRLRREVDPRQRRQCFCVLGLSVAVFSLVFLCARQHFQFLRYGYQIEQLKLERAALEQWNARLRLEQARLDDPQRIDTLARERLGLAPPGPYQIVRLDTGLANPQPPTAPEMARNFSDPTGALSRVP